MEQGHISIDVLYNAVIAGQIRIPSFQRGFVWSSEQVAFLYDSLYKGYPIGNLLLWETTKKLQCERTVGSLESPDASERSTVQYVLDGQQRLTSLCGLFNKEILAKDNPEWLDIYIDLDGAEDAQNSLFLPLKPEDVVEGRHFPVSKIMNSAEYRKATRDLPEESAEKLDVVFRRISTKVIPTEKMTTEDMNKVAIVFERVNTAGTDLDHYQLLSAWSWSEEFVLQERFSQLADELEAFGIESTNSQHIDLLLKCCTSVIANDASTNAIINLNGQEVRDKFNSIENGIKSSIEFLKQELKIYHIKYLPYPTMLISLTKFFATDAALGDAYTDRQREKLIKWFWKVSFSKRYSSSLDTKFPKDIRDMQTLRANQDAQVFNFECEVPQDYFLVNQFNPQGITTKVFVTLLANHNPVSFISGTPVDLATKLRQSYKTEFHHIFPVKFLEREGKPKKQVSILANFCFLSKADNLSIRDKAPSDYRTLINNEQRVLESALCPENSFDLSYEDFIHARNIKLLDRARGLIV